MPLPKDLPATLLETYMAEQALLTDIHPDLQARLNGFTYLAEPQSLSDSQIMQYIYDISTEVSKHNGAHPGTMFERPPEEYIHMFRENHVVLLRQPDGNFAYFGGISPKFSAAQQDVYGTQLVELVNSISHPGLRNHGMGTIGSVLRMELAKKLYGDNILTFFETENGTVSRTWHETHKYLDKPWQTQPVAFNEFPYLAGLTCRYGEFDDSGKHPCHLRRRPAAQSSPEDFNRVLSHDLPKVKMMPCTLEVSDINRAVAFQERCMQLHWEFLGTPPVILEPGEELTRDHINQVSIFYDTVSKLTESNGYH